MMNYYDALLQHRQQVADAERQHEHARLLRESRRAQEKASETEKTDRPSPLTRIVLDLKTTFNLWRASRRQPVQPACLKEAL